MCSIFGCLNYNNYLSSKEFIKSNNSMINRGPDYSEVKEYIIEDGYGNIYQYLTSPIVNNEKVYGVIILNYAIR